MGLSVGITASGGKVINSKICLPISNSDISCSSTNFQTTEFVCFGKWVLEDLTSELPACYTVPLTKEDCI